MSLCPTAPLYRCRRPPFRSTIIPMSNPCRQAPPGGHTGPFCSKNGCLSVRIGPPHSTAREYNFRCFWLQKPFCVSLCATAPLHRCCRPPFDRPTAATGGRGQRPDAAPLVRSPPREIRLLNLGTTFQGDDELCNVFCAIGQAIQAQRCIIFIFSSARAWVNISLPFPRFERNKDPCDHRHKLLVKWYHSGRCLLCRNAYR